MSDASQAAEIDIEPERVARELAQTPALQLIDVREAAEREAGHIAGSRHVELAKVASQADTVERERPVIFYCRAGSRSKMAAQAFRTAGFDAYSMSGGLKRWAEEGRPLSPEGGRVAEH
jgi:rhodanese-related sulfurtransferase